MSDRHARPQATASTTSTDFPVTKRMGDFSIFDDDEPKQSKEQKLSHFVGMKEKMGPFVGLDNQGATCYLNSLLQTMFMTLEFRAGLFALSTLELEYGRYMEEEAKRKAAEIAEAASGKKEPTNSGPPQERVDDLVAMGFDAKNAVKALKLYPSMQEQEQCLDYLVTHDFSQDPPEPESEQPQEPPKPKIRKIPIELRKLFALLQASDMASVSTQGLTRSFGWNSGDGQAAAQHDIQELNRLLMEALEGSLRGTSQADTLQSLYQGTQVTKIMCCTCNTITTREEPFFDLPTQVAGFPDMKWSLNEYVAPELLNGRNQYRCSTCNKKCDAKKGVALRTLPPVLTFSLSRFVFDYASLQRNKLHDKFSFPIFLDMAPFLEPNLDFKSQRSKDQVVADLKAAGKSSSEPVPGAAATGESSLPPSTADGKSNHVIEEDASGTERVIVEDVFTDERYSAEKEAQGSQSRKRRKKKEDEKKDEPQLPLEWGAVDSTSPHRYQLFAVVVHAGSAYGGHYHALIRNMSKQEEDKTSEWYDFNDSVIRPIAVEDVAKQYGSTTSESAYMLIYRLCSFVPPATPLVPEPEKSDIETANSTLKRDRERYESVSNEIKVVVRSERSLVIENSHLKDLDPKNTFEVLFDQRQPQAALAARIREVLTQANECPPNDLKLNVVDYWNDGAPFKIEIGAAVTLEGDAPVQAAKHFYSGFVTNLIAWDGENIKGEKYARQEHKVSVSKMAKMTCRYHTWQTPDFPTEFELELPGGSTLLELCQLLEQRVGLDVMEQHLHLIRDFCCDVSPAMLTEPMEESGLEDGCTFALEKRSGDSASSLARARFESTKTALTLTVLVAWESVSRSRLAIKADRSASLTALKNAIVNQLPSPTTSEAGFRLRRVIGESKLAALYTCEEETLAKLGFDETTTVRIEKGALPTADQLDLLVTVVSTANVDQRAERVWQHHRLPVLVEKSITFQAFIAHVLGVANVKSEVEFHVYRTTADDSRGKAFGNEELTLAGCQIANGDVLWLEEGPVQAEGEIKLDVLVDFVSNRESIASWVEKQSGGEKKKEGAGEEKKEGGAIAPQKGEAMGSHKDLLGSLCKCPPSETKAVEVAPKADAPTPKPDAPAPKSPGESKPELNYLLTLQISSQSPLSALKARLYESSAPLREHAPSAAYLRIRHVTRSNDIGKLIGCDDASLKVQGLNSNKRVVVQVMSDPEAGLSKHAAALAVYRVLPVATTNDKKELQLGPLPPEQVVFDGGATPGAADLLGRLSALTNIPLERLVCAKWFGQNRGWSRSTLASFTTLQQSAPVKPDDAANLLRKPFLLKDGDVLCVADTNDFPSGQTAEACVSSWPYPVIVKSVDEHLYPSAPPAPPFRREEPTLKIKY